MYERLLKQRLLEALTQYPVVTVMGPRQSGKTTLVRSALPHYAYVNLERPDNRRLALQDPKSFFAAYPAPVILDEAQRVPELLSWIQADIDERGGNGHYVITGSNQPELSSALAQSLAGRTTILHLLPLSLEELISSSQEFDRDECLFKGFLPRIHAENQPPVQAYTDYTATYVERDVRRLVNVRDLSKFELFLRLLAGRIGQILNLNALSRDIGISSTTLEHWISVLEASFIVIRLRPWFSNIGKRLVKQPKLYFLEVGLASSLLQIESPEQAARDPLLGNLFENMMVVEFLKAFWNRGQNAHLYFYRDSSGNEIDLIIERNRVPHPVEIKASRTYHPDFAKALSWFRSIEGMDCGSGAVVYGGDETWKRENLALYGFAGAAKSIFDSIASSLSD